MATAIDVLIIGAGVVGCATARELARWDVRVRVVDRAMDVADGTSRANSGIAHAGFDATNGTLKAHYNVLGSRMLPELARNLGFDYMRNGSLVLAFNDEERKNLRALLRNGEANGVEGLRIVDADELRRMEPNVSCDAEEALYAPTGAIVNPYEMTFAFAQNAVANGADFLLGHEVTSIERVAFGAGGFRVALKDLVGDGTKLVLARCVVNATGVFADRVAALVGIEMPAITARRGEYVLLDKRAARDRESMAACEDALEAAPKRGAVTHTVFRAPSSVGKGVLVSPTVDGNIIVGPNAHAVDKYLSDGAVDTTREGIDEVLCKARDLWPELPESQVITRFAGLRATPANGDFAVGEADDCPGFFSASGIESPGLTAAPAIAVDLATLVAARLGAQRRNDFNPCRKRPLRFADMDSAARAAAVAKDSAWGRALCRCEQVTDAEIRAAVRGDETDGVLPAITLDAVKWRTRAGMGRCHGGFCSPHVARIIAEETGCAIGEVLKRDVGSRIGCVGGDDKCGVCFKGEPARSAVNVAREAERSIDAVAPADVAPADVAPAVVAPADGASPFGVSSVSSVSSTSSVSSAPSSACFLSRSAAIEYVDIAVVGGGAAGIAAALSAVREGIAPAHILLIDRESALGGILKQCIHPGFGLERYREELTGPEYAARDIADLSASDVRVMSDTTVTSLNVSEEAQRYRGLYNAPARGAGSAHGYELYAVGPAGSCVVCARAVVLATGSRERSVGQVDLFGSRPAGVYTAGCAQHLVNLMGVLPGREVVLYGSGDIGLIMARRLAWEGVRVKACVVRGTRPSGLRRNVKQCLEDNNIPILLSHAVTRVLGDGARVSGVEVCKTDPATKTPLPGTESVIECDTLLLSCGLIPEQDLLVDAGGAAVSRGSVETTWPGVYLCGNAAGIHDIVDHVTEEGMCVGCAAARWVLGSESDDASEARADVGADAAGKRTARTAKIDAARAGAFAEADTEGADGVEGEEITCICCPIGCTLYAQRSDKAANGVFVTGNRCKRGVAYAAEELTAPRRVLTSIVRCEGRLEPVSVRTDIPILRSDIPACLETLRDVCVSGPVKIGDIIVSDICGTDANVVATKAVVWKD